MKEYTLNLIKGSYCHLGYIFLDLRDIGVTHGPDPLPFRALRLLGLRVLGFRVLWFLKFLGFRALGF